MNPASIERDEARHAQPGRRERPGQREPDGAVVGEHLADERLARFAKPAAVVRQERGVDEIGQTKSSTVTAGGSIRLRLMRWMYDGSGMNAASRRHSQITHRPDVPSVRRTSSRGERPAVVRRNVRGTTALVEPLLIVGLGRGEIRAIVAVESQPPRIAVD